MDSLAGIARSRTQLQLRLGAGTGFQCRPASVVRKSTQGTGLDCDPYFSPWTHATEASTGATSPSAIPLGRAALWSHVRPESAVTQAALPLAAPATDPS